VEGEVEVQVNYRYENWLWRSLWMNNLEIIWTYIFTLASYYAVRLRMTMTYWSLNSSNHFLSPT